MDDLTRISFLARKQGGTFTADQWRRSGLAPHQLARQTASGAFVRVARGRYAPAFIPQDWLAQVWSATALLPDRAGASHRTAAALWELSGYRPGPIEVLVPVGCGTRSPLAKVHRSRNLAEDDFTRTAEGLALTSVARTLVDLASVERYPPRFLNAFDDAICRKLTTTDVVVEVADRILKGGRKGRALLDSAVAQWDPSLAPENLGEMAVVRLLLEAGYPRPETQYELRDSSNRFIARVDIAYPAQRLVIERDSQRWHGSQRAVDKDIQRELRIQAAGWHVRRIGHREIQAGAHSFLAALAPLFRPDARRTPDAG